MIKEKAWAKLNLSLNIIPDIDYKKDTGYYPVQFVNCELNLHDELIFEKQKNLVEVFCSSPSLSPTNNSVYESIILLKKILHIPELGAKINLSKNIPIKAGFGGGSSDAAAALRGFLKLWRIHASQEVVSEVIRTIGSDVYYSYQGRVCEVGGRGEKISPIINRMPRFWIVIIVPDEHKPSTGWMYSQLDISKIGAHRNTITHIKNGIQDGDKKSILLHLHNDFESVIQKQFQTIYSMKKILMSYGAKKTLFAGSGLSVVGFFLNQKSAQEAQKKLSVHYNNCILTRTK